MFHSVDFYLISHVAIVGFTEHYCNINRKNNINMGGNGEAASIDPARRVCIPESRQEHPRVPQIRGGLRGQIPATASSSETRPAAPEPSRLPKRFKGMVTFKFFLKVFISKKPSRLRVSL